MKHLLGTNWSSPWEGAGSGRLGRHCRRANNAGQLRSVAHGETKVVGDLQLHDSLEQDSAELLRRVISDVSLSEPGEWSELVNVDV